jgi:hypothetical protein
MQNILESRLGNKFQNRNSGYHDGVYSGCKHRERLPINIITTMWDMMMIAHSLIIIIIIIIITVLAIFNIIKQHTLKSAWGRSNSCVDEDIKSKLNTGLLSYIQFRISGLIGK